MISQKDKDLARLYKEIPNVIEEICKQKGSSPDNIGYYDQGISGNKTIWDINPTGRDKLIRLNSTVECTNCKKEINGDVILEKDSLTVRDTSNFLLLSDGAVCKKCLENL